MRIDELKRLCGAGRPLIVGCGVTGASVARHFARFGVAFDVADAAADGARAALTRALADVDLPLANALDTARFHDSLDAIAAYDVLVLSPGIPRGHPAVRGALARGASVIGDIELFAGASSAGRTVAVTGSNGKSTVVAWLAHALRGAGVDARECGNIGVPALDALAAHGEGARTDASRPGPVYVLELSSYQLESTHALAPLAACVLNVSDDHLDRYDSIEHYGAVKRRVYARAGAAICNADDARTRPDDRAADATFAVAAPSVAAPSVAAPSVAPATPTAATPATAPGTASVPVRWHLGDAANDARGGGTGQDWLCRDGVALLERARLGPPGRHNALNALAVLALGEAALDALGVSSPDGVAGTDARLLDALQGWSGLPHRTELVHEAAGVRWYDDSKGTNVDACAKAIDAMPGAVVLIMGGLSKGADFRPLAPLVRERVRLLVLIGRDRAEIRRALDGATAMREADTLEGAVLAARDAARPGDAVLLSPACASFDMFDNFEERGRRFAAAARAEAAA